MSSQPVSLAKTTRPALGSVVRREALFVRLDGQPGRTLAWISGPPGAGKSTLAASYAEARGYQCAWYQLDPDDADVATFFHYLGHAARKLGDGQPPDLPAFIAQHLQNVAAFSRRFFRQLFSRARTQAALVLDNLHEAAANTPLQEVLQAGLAQVPRHCCVIVTSRGEPLAALAQMRVSGEMACVGGDDLRIGPHELAEIASLRGLSLPPDAVAKLQERTQGWAAGLVLMLEHAKISGRIAEFPDDATPKLMFDYFAGEIFDRFEAATRQFLLRIACLPSMTVAVAEALSGEKNAGRLLVNLAHNEYFLRETVTDDTRVYQLHPLLREFLRNRAIHTLPAAMGAAELQRAAALLRSAGQNDDAVALLIECRDWSEVARIAAEQAAAMLAQGRSETLAGWLELLPRQLLDADPRLLHVLAASRVHASPRAARRLFEQAYAGLHRTGDKRATVQCCRGIINAIILEFDDLAALDHWIEALASLLEAGLFASPGAVDPGAAETLIRAVLLRDPGNPDLEKWLGRAEHAAGAHADTQTGSDVLAELALARAMAAQRIAGPRRRRRAIAPRRPRIHPFSAQLARRPRRRSRGREPRGEVRARRRRGGWHTVAGMSRACRRRAGYVVGRRSAWRRITGARRENSGGETAQPLAGGVRATRRGRRGDRFPRRKCRTRRAGRRVCARASTDSIICPEYARRCWPISARSRCGTTWKRRSCAGSSPPAISPLHARRCI